MSCGSRASSSSFCRTRLTCRSIERSNGSASRPCVRLSNWSRLSTRLGCSRKTLSRRNSAPDKTTTTPCALTRCLAVRSSVHPAKRMRVASAGFEVRRQRFGASQDAANAREQLPRLERLGEIVVGAHFQADDTVDRLTARGQHDHRQVRSCAQASGTVAGRLRRASSGQGRSGRCAPRRAPSTSPRRRPPPPCGNRCRRDSPTAACEFRDRHRRPESCGCAFMA